MVPRSELLLYVTRLGREFKRRGMNDHAKRLRLYYLAIRHGLTTRGNDVDFKWSEAFVVEWMKTLQLEPFAHDYPVRRRNAPCLRCREKSDRQSIATIGNLPEGAKIRCGTCGSVWLEK